MNRSIRLLAASAVLVMSGLSAVASASTAEVVVVAPGAPPVERFEAVPAPRAGYAWDKGHWRWEHGRYAWVPGRWQVQRVGYHWMPGHWVAHGPNWRWVEGHWA
ncbi:hypothetical protein GCT13_19445 [Paraburkholderia sp. CNPSo 3157]|uniref:YXWGXW repeat-containing protein n=1 Tax=Paraburkholderia franconis TaxID=2654983 RepID=A0A7X1NBP1_9BURK|nr:YXWGXW repeat-containing protein [Paraburkholderia franconis]MPW19012.1 hypothetical protein [Paraburkholderia franconis]